MHVVYIQYTNEGKMGQKWKKKTNKIITDRHCTKLHKVTYMYICTYRVGVLTYLQLFIVAIGDVYIQVVGSEL